MTNMLATRWKSPWFNSAQYPNNKEALVGFGLLKGQFDAISADPPGEEEGGHGPRHKIALRSSPAHRDSIRLLRAGHASNSERNGFMGSSA